eukprot:TRINITY_DN2322_c0_g1_i2.p1 TRINITY_DN2322_c0_g1~~TRINITY_DN2322_c0_g1_i2.p1  ORF type:complete len:237 (-),score=22.01 TRINITY_DN2322_c0_g1_i2:62-772(-)
MMDPITQVMGLGNLAYYFSIADINEANHIRMYEKYIHEALEQEYYLVAFHYFDQLINGDFFEYPTYFYNITGSHDYFNIRSPKYAPDEYGKFMSSPTMREALHLGNIKFWDYNQTVEYHLLHDWMVSVKPIIEVLLDNYRVLIYNGQNDVILSGPLCENFLRTLRWSGEDQYLKSKKIIWRVDPNDKHQEVAGYARVVNDFWQVLVRDAGHMVPTDQPQRAYDMIRRFIDNVPFDQ